MKTKMADFWLPCCLEIMAMGLEFWGKRLFLVKIHETDPVRLPSSGQVSVFDSHTKSLFVLSSKYSSGEGAIYL